MYFTDSELTVLKGAGGGTLVLMLLQGKLDWKLALTIFLVGLLSAYFFTIPVCEIFNMGQEYYGPIGFVVAFGGMYVLLGFLSVLRNFSEQPLAVLSRLPIVRNWIWKDKDDDSSRSG